MTQLFRFTLIPEGRYRATIISMTKRKNSSVELLDFVITSPNFAPNHNDEAIHWIIRAPHSIAQLLFLPILVDVTIQHEYEKRTIRSVVSDVIAIGGAVPPIPPLDSN